MVHEVRSNNLLAKVKAFKKSVGNKIFYSIVLLPLLLLGSAIAFLQADKIQDLRQRAAPTQNNLNRITYMSKEWYLHGANVPWYNWACDFGCNQNGGVSGNLNILRSRFENLKTADMHLARWWVFPADPWQITRSQDGSPNGINPSVYADFDAALVLAEEYDLYYNFVLFSSATDIPQSWLTNPTQRNQLAAVLGTLFARYKENPRVMSWEIFNEPEFQIWGGQVQEEHVVATVEAISNSVHQNSDALTTVGGAMLDGLSMWTSTGLDYYSPHWYDYMDSGGWCARCTDFETIKNRFGLQKPVIIGELYIGTDTDSLQRYNDFYNKGFAGAWPWSLFPERTADNLGIDFQAASQFAQTKNDIGPNSNTTIPPSVTPTNVPPPQATPTNTPVPQPTTTNTPIPQPSPTNTPIPPPLATSTPTPQPTATNTPVPQPTATPTKTPAQKADFNNSGTVDIQDLSYLLSRWNSNDLTADINNDGSVGIIDLSVLLSNWGS